MPGPAADTTVRPRLLDAADALLARRGYAEMTIAAVATEAGVGKGSVYLHFASKQALAVACIDRMAERVLGTLDHLAGERTTAPERLRAMLHARVMLRFDYAQGHAASLDDLLSAVRPALLERRREQFAAETAVFARVLESGARERTLRRVPASAAGAMVTATNALLPYSLSAAELGQRRALEQRVEALADLLLHGLLTPLTRRR
jgi:AcrR family transcriptional regulator